MKRLMLTLSSLALLGVACGGRVLDRGDGGSGASTGTSGNGDGAGTVSSTGSAGRPSGIGGKSTGSGGASSSGMVGPGKAGATGVGGKSAGMPTGGTFAIGGDSGVGGAVIGWGGAGPDGTEACARYCTAYAKICPQAGLGSPDECTRECVASLQLDSTACAVGKRDAYECIGNAMFQAPNDCSKALITAKELCGSATPQVSACNASCVPSSIYGGGGDGCHATAVCNGVEVDLHCEDPAGDVPCTCSIDGKPIWDIATGFDSSKAGCIDEAMFRMCAKELP
jgi:hypothetical protein